MINNKKVISIIMDKDLDGFLEVSSHNWNGKIFKIHISIVDKYYNNNLSCIGIYFLVSSNNNFIYIGDSENILYKLNKHLENYKNNEKCFHWNYAFVLTWDDLDKSSIMYIKKKFYDYFSKHNIWKIFHEFDLKNIKLSYDREISCNEYTETSINILQALGLIALEKNMPINNKCIEKSEVNKKLILKNNDKWTFKEKIINNSYEWYKLCYLKKSIIRNNDEFTINIFYKIFKLLFVKKITHKKICEELSIYDNRGWVMNIIIHSLYLNKENHHEFCHKEIIFTLDKYNIFFDKNKRHFNNVIEVINLLIVNKDIKKMDFERFINEKNNV